jgi:hypothetical protein
MAGAFTRRWTRGFLARSPKHIRQLYADWADQPLPALDGRTPRQAIQTPDGLEQVKFLLHTYEHGESQQAKAQQRPAVSYEFLWQELGITPVGLPLSPSLANFCHRRYCRIMSTMNIRLRAGPSRPALLAACPLSLPGLLRGQRGAYRRLARTPRQRRYPEMAAGATGALKPQSAGEPDAKSKVNLSWS